MESLKSRKDDDYASTEEVSAELRERAMRLVAEARKEDWELSVNAAVVRIGQHVGVNATRCGAGASRLRSTRANAPGTTTSDAQRIKALEAKYAS